ncbi:MAG: leucyl aminopeptidase family protein, partial [Rhodospirillales bacterium]|nr:leucyl aminopeptidase family protein [Rhodospirillales bacterium]
MESCFAEAGVSLPLHIVTPAGLAAALPPGHRAYCEACGFTGQAQRLILLPALGGDGGSALAGAVLGLGDGPVTPMSFGGLALGLPEGSLWHLADHAHAAAAVLGWGLGAYRYGRFKPAKRAPARLVLPGAASDQAALAQLQA